MTTDDVNPADASSSSPVPPPPFVEMPRPRDCPVCMNRITRTHRPLSCGHYVHRACIVRSGRPLCPLCRTRLVEFTADGVGGERNVLYRRLEAVRQRRESSGESESDESGASGTAAAVASGAESPTADTLHIEIPAEIVAHLIAFYRRFTERQDGGTGLDGTETTETTETSTPLDDYVAEIVDHLLPSPVGETTMTTAADVLLDTTSIEAVEAAFDDARALLDGMLRTLVHCTPPT